MACGCSTGSGAGSSSRRRGGSSSARPRAILDRARAAELRLSELGALTRGTLAIWASFTSWNTWLLLRLVRFRALYPGIALHLTPANTQGGDRGGALWARRARLRRRGPSTARA